MNKKLISCILLFALLAVTLCGCTKDDVLKAFSIDTDTYDPATEMAAEVLGKTAAEEDLTAGDLSYLLYSDGTAAVTGYTGSNPVLEIPEQIDGHTVVALENKALYDNEVITELTLPDSLEVVGNYAVMYCKNLQKVTFGKNIRSIGVSAFESEGDDSNSRGSGSLTTLEFRGAPEIIREKAFYYADKLTEIVLPAGVKTIEEWAFAKCMAAQRIVLGDGLEFLGDHAFLKCRGAKEVVLPGSLKTVETSAFYQCTSLETLTLGEGIETLKKGAFEECTALKTVTLPESIVTMEPYIFYNCSALETCRAGSPQTLEKDIFTGAPNVHVYAPAGSALLEYAASHDLAYTAVE